jgi:hypothetical protein
MRLAIIFPYDFALEDLLSKPHKSLHGMQNKRQRPNLVIRFRIYNIGQFVFKYDTDYTTVRLQPSTTWTWKQI